MHKPKPHPSPKKETPKNSTPKSTPRSSPKKGNQTPRSPVRSKPHSKKKKTPHQDPHVSKSPGLDYLAHLEYLFLKQQFPPAGVANFQNFHIFNSRGEAVYFAKKASGIAGKRLQKDFKFEMIVRNSAGHIIMHFAVPHSGSSDCCCTKKGKLYVYAPPNKLVGSVSHTGTGCMPKFDVINSIGKKAYKIKGPCCLSSKDAPQFIIYEAKNKRQIGKINKRSGGETQQVYSNCDNYGIHFPLGVSVQSKALFLGACILLDYMFYESPGVIYQNPPPPIVYQNPPPPIMYQNPPPYQPNVIVVGYDSSSSCFIGCHRSSSSLFGYSSSF